MSMLNFKTLVLVALIIICFTLPALTAKTPLPQVVANLSKTCTWNNVSEICTTLPLNADKCLLRIVKRCDCTTPSSPTTVGHSQAICTEGSMRFNLEHVDCNYHANCCTPWSTWTECQGGRRTRFRQCTCPKTPTSPTSVYTRNWIFNFPGCLEIRLCTEGERFDDDGGLIAGRASVVDSFCSFLHSASVLELTVVFGFALFGFGLLTVPCIFWPAIIKRLANRNRGLSRLEKVETQPTPGNPPTDGDVHSKAPRIVAVEAPTSSGLPPPPPYAP